MAEMADSGDEKMEGVESGSQSHSEDEGGEKTKDPQVVNVYDCGDGELSPCDGDSDGDDNHSRKMAVDEDEESSPDNDGDDNHNSEMAEDEDEDTSPNNDADDNHSCNMAVDESPSPRGSSVKGIEPSRSWHGVETTSTDEIDFGAHDLLDVTFQKSRIDVRPNNRRPSQNNQRRRGSLSDVYVEDLWAKGGPYDSDDSGDEADAVINMAGKKLGGIPGIGMMGGIGMALPPMGAGGFGGLKKTRGPGGAGAGIAGLASAVAGGASNSRLRTATVSSTDSAQEVSWRMKSLKKSRATAARAKIEDNEDTEDANRGQSEAAAPASAFGAVRLKQTGNRPIQPATTTETSSVPSSPFGNIKLKSRGGVGGLKRESVDKSTFESPMMKRKSIDASSRGERSTSNTSANSDSSDSAQPNMFANVLKKTNNLPKPSSIDKSSTANNSQTSTSSQEKPNPFAGVLNKRQDSSSATTTTPASSPSKFRPGAASSDPTSTKGTVSAARACFSAAPISPLVSPAFSRANQKRDATNSAPKTLCSDKSYDHNDPPSKPNPFEGVLKKSRGTVNAGISESRSASDVNSAKSKELTVGSSPALSSRGRSQVDLSQTQSEFSNSNRQAPGTPKKSGSVPINSGQTSTAKTNATPSGGSSNNSSDDIPEWKKKLKNKQAERLAVHGSVESKKEPSGSKGSGTGGGGSVLEFQRMALRKTGSIMK